VRGLIAWFVHNPVTANLLMAFVVVAGVLALGPLEREVLPTARAAAATIVVLYPGAGPAEVEEGLCAPIEEAVQGVKGVDRVRSTAREGVALVVVEFVDRADERRILDDLQLEVDQLDDLPEEAEEPVVTLVEIDNRVLTVAVSGAASRADLRRAAETVEDALLAQPEISLVRVAGEPEPEIWIELDELALDAWNLTLAEVAAAVQRNSLDLPAGSVRAAEGHLLLRAHGQALHARDFERIPLRTGADGTRLAVGDVARVREAWAETDQESRLDGVPAVMLDVFRTVGQDALKMKDDVLRALDAARALLPEGITLTLLSDDTQLLRERLDLMLRNGRAGLALVLVTLALFLRLRLAFWVTAGIPVTLLGAICLMPLLGVSINLISLFAFILVLGIVVDDAIVVAENILRHRQAGASPVDAAIRGAQEVAVPVVFAVLTTMAAFAPMVALPGTMGQYARNVPLIVIAALLFSLLEAFLVLPGHLRNLPPPEERRRGPWARVQGAVTGALDAFTERGYRPLLARAIEARWLTIAVGIALLLVTIGWVGSGRVRFNFFPQVESDWIMAEVTMPLGTPPERTRAVLARFEDAADSLRAELHDDAGGAVIRHVRSSLGSQPVRTLLRSMGGSAALGPGESGSHLGEVWLELASSEVRTVRAAEIAARWRDAVGPVAGAEEITVVDDFMASDGDVNLQLSGVADAQLADAAAALRDHLAAQPGVDSARSTYRPGKPELRLRLTPEGEALGFTLAELATQARHAFFGLEAQEFQRGRDTVQVRVLLAEAERSRRDALARTDLRAPDGRAVPFLTAAAVDERPGAAVIERVDRNRVVSVLATVRKSVTSPDEIVAGLEPEFLPALQARHPGLRWEREGSQREQAEFLARMGRIALIALIAIYVLLAIPLRSYAQPLVIMSAIPFGLVGAVLGHAVLGLDLTMFSLIGVIALAGIAVNDSLVMMDFVNRARAEGASLREAALQAGPRRLVAILLTSLTTVAGLAPLVLERSLQAQFLIPMAVSVAFGVAVATLITLLLVPALLLAQDDVQRLGRRLLRHSHGEEAQ
jgi:multidrug efflux pump subunit AcrB